MRDVLRGIRHIEHELFTTATAESIFDAAKVVAVATPKSPFSIGRRLSLYGKTKAVSFAKRVRSTHAR